jgi:hypothetical protein
MAVLVTRSTVSIYRRLILRDHFVMYRNTGMTLDELQILGVFNCYEGKQV